MHCCHCKCVWVVLFMLPSNRLWISHGVQRLRPSDVGWVWGKWLNSGCISIIWWEVTGWKNKSRNQLQFILCECAALRSVAKNTRSHTVFCPSDRSASSAVCFNNSPPFALSSLLSLSSLRHFSSTCHQSFKMCYHSIIVHTMDNFQEKVNNPAVCCPMEWPALSTVMNPEVSEAKVTSGSNIPPIPRKYFSNALFIFQ